MNNTLPLRRNYNLYKWISMYSLFRCDQCDFRASQAWQLSDHASQHEIKGFSCDKCDYTTNRIMFLNRHKKVSIEINLGVMAIGRSQMCFASQV